MMSLSRWMFTRLLPASARRMASRPCSGGTACPPMRKVTVRSFSCLEVSEGASSLAMDFLRDAEVLAVFRFFGGISPPHADDPSYAPALCVHDQNEVPLEHADSDMTILSIVLAVVHEGERRACEHCGA